MQKDIQIRQKIKQYASIFDPRTYNTFTGVVRGILCLRDWRQADIAHFTGKTLEQIQYFFSRAKWSFKLLNKLRVSGIRNKKGCADKKSDIVIFDGSVFTKNMQASFQGLTDLFWSNRDKKIVNGFELFGASVLTTSGVKYLFDIMLYFKKGIGCGGKKRTGTNKKKRRKETQSHLMNAWRKFIARVCKKTKAWIVVIDSGFREANMCKWIHQVIGKHFLVRIDNDASILQNVLCLIDGKRRGRKPGLSETYVLLNKLLCDENALFFSQGKMWVFESVYLKSWIKKGVCFPVNIIVFWQNGFKKPIFLATSASLEDVYENMFRKPGDPNWSEKQEEFLSSHNQISGKHMYVCFAKLFFMRWTIEMCFKEMKSYLGFEDFRLQSYESIMKYLHIIILVHTLLTVMLIFLLCCPLAHRAIYEYLKKKRNIKNPEKSLTIIGIKLFIEMISLDRFSGSSGLTPELSLFQNALLQKPNSFNSGSFLLLD